MAILLTELLTARGGGGAWAAGAVLTVPAYVGRGAGVGGALGRITDWRAGVLGMVTEGEVW